MAKTKDIPPEEFLSKFRNKIDANFLHKIQVFSLSLFTRTNFVDSKDTKNTFVSRNKKTQRHKKLKLKMRKNGEAIFYQGDSTRGSG